MAADPEGELRMNRFVQASVTVVVCEVRKKVKERQLRFS
jgi:hypothetical protein